MTDEREMRERAEAIVSMTRDGMVNYYTKQYRFYEDRPVEKVVEIIRAERDAAVEECAAKLEAMAAKATEISNGPLETQWIRDCNSAEARTLTKAAAAIRTRVAQEKKV